MVKNETASKKVIPIAAVVLTATVGFLFLVNYKISCVRTELTELEATTRASSAVTAGLEKSMKRYELNYEDIVEFTYDSQNNIKSVQTNVVELTRLGNDIGVCIDDEINKMGTYELKIPLSTLLNIDIFSGIGPEIPIYVTMKGITGTKFSNSFSAAGINQTLHRIMLQINVKSYVIFSGRVRVVEYSSNVCVAESVIVGVTPETFAEFAS